MCQGDSTGSFRADRFDYLLVKIVISNDILLHQRLTSDPLSEMLGPCASTGGPSARPVVRLKHAGAVFASKQ